MRQMPKYDKEKDDKICTPFDFFTKWQFGPYLTCSFCFTGPATKSHYNTVIEFEFEFEFYYSHLWFQI